ncbi:MAG: cytochrome c, partial [Chloroflexi bacterium]|nr:cytochrome c [Chloroflexota bacterium]
DDSESSSANEEPAAIVSTGDPEAGEAKYGEVCIACHGPNGEGIEGLGKPFTTSDFLRERNDEEMLEFITTGRPSSDPLNTTGIDMPPKGGNPALSDEQIMDIIAYIRTTQ